MGRLFCIIGKSGSGKDAVFKRLLCDVTLKLTPVVTYTTRPRRVNETNGVEYNFITESELFEYKKAGKVIEMRKYDTIKGVWYYCTVDDGVINLANGDYLAIATLEGLSVLKERFCDAVVPLYIEVEDGERLSRALLRERSQASPDYCELCRRFLADSEDFSKSRLNAVGINSFFANDNFDRCIKQINTYILNYDKNNLKSITIGF
jgi:guanylate kinase